MNDMREMLEMLEAYGLDEQALMAVGVIALVTALIVGIVNLAMYILKAVGIYSIAKRRGISQAWLAWIPVADYWVVGSLADQYQQTVKNKNSNIRIFLIILAVLSCVMTWVINGIYYGGLAESFASAADGDLESLVFALTMAGGSSRVLDLVQQGLSIALLVFWQIALYFVYCSSCPKYSVLYLVLGIIFPFTVPFYLFFNRKKDEGMRIPQPEAVPEA